MRGSTSIVQWGQGEIHGPSIDVRLGSHLHLPPARSLGPGLTARIIVFRAHPSIPSHFTGEPQEGSGGGGLDQKLLLLNRRGQGSLGYP